MNPVFDNTGSLHKTLAYEILSGFYPAGSKLPSERDLSEKYRISRNTVRLTLEELEAAGAIRRRPRSGAVVTADAPAILRAAPAAQAELSAALILPPDQISNPVVQAIFTVFCKYCSEKVRISVVFIDQLASEDFRSLRADMAILFAVPEAAVRRRLAQRIGRLVLLNATAGDCDYIAPDNRLAGRLIAEHLLECGHRSIGGITFDDRDPGSDFRQRLDGCAEVFDAAGAALHLTRISALKFSDARFRRKLVEPMVKAGHSALIGGCDAIAAELCAAVFAAGKRVPADVSIAGFDDQFYTQFMLPALTTVKYPAEAIGIHLAAVTDELLAGRDGHIRKLVPPILVKRASILNLSHRTEGEEE